MFCLTNGLNFSDFLSLIPFAQFFYLSLIFNHYCSINFQYFFTPCPSRNCGINSGKNIENQDKNSN